MSSRFGLGSVVAAMLAEAALASPSAFEAWDKYQKQVRDQAAPKDSLKSWFPSLYAAVKGSALPGSGAIDSPWVFPLSGYSIASVGKGGFQPGIRYGGGAVKGYDFFDGNRHGGHPAYDIFIRDKDQDARDDRTGKPVEVLAPARLVVLSTEAAWEPGSALRGGKYVWALLPRSDLLLYFAHLDSVFAKPGDTLDAGQPLGIIGRTGKNAHAKRSPTHLHLMALRVAEGRPRPFDYRRLLLRR